MARQAYTIPIEALKSDKDLIDYAQKQDIRFVDFRFTDLFGTWHHKTCTLEHLVRHPDSLEKGIYFDGSSIKGWKHIHESDMLLKPDIKSSRVDPFGSQKTGDTLAIVCDVYEPRDGKPYARDPRSIAKRAEEYMRSTGIADKALFGPEPEFFILDGIGIKADGSVDVKSCELPPADQIGHYAPIKGGYFPLPPVDKTQHIRAEIADVLEGLGFDVECHHHEVARPGQAEVNIAAAPLVEMADRTQWLKYVTKMVAERHGKIATFMPKVVLDDNGSGMHVNMSLRQGDKTVFSGEGYGGLSELAECYIGGILEHGPALRALCSPTSNSDQRLVPGFEAPTYLAYAQGNRSAAVRVPFSSSPSSRRMEARFPDPSANPYLAFSALLLAGLDGARKGISPGNAAEFDIYEHKQAGLKQLPGSVGEAWKALDADDAWLTQVIPRDALNALKDARLKEVESVQSAVKAAGDDKEKAKAVRIRKELEMYLSC